MCHLVLQTYTVLQTHRSTKGHEGLVHVINFEIRICMLFCFSKHISAHLQTFSIISLVDEIKKAESSFALYVFVVENVVFSNSRGLKGLKVNPPLKCIFAIYLYTLNCSQSEEVGCKLFSES